DTVLLAVFRSTFVTGYAKYLLFDVALGFAPLALVALGLTTWDVPAVVSALTASVFLLGLLVFVRKQLIAEIRQLFSARASRPERAVFQAAPPFIRRYSV